MRLCSSSVLRIDGKLLIGFATECTLICALCTIGVEVRTTGHFSQKFQKRIQNAYNVGLDHVIACDLDVLQYLQHIYDSCREDKLNIWPIYWSLSYRLIRVSTIKIPDIYINL